MPLRHQLDALRTMRSVHAQATFAVPNDTALDALQGYLVDFIDTHELKTPALLPTHDGRVRAEWHGRSGVMCAEFDLATRTATLRVTDERGALVAETACAMDDPQCIADFFTQSGRASIVQR